MKSVEIHHTARFSVVSFGNGTAYEMKPHDQTDWLLFQGDDAAEFRDRLDSMEAAHPERPTDDILRELWNGYVA